MVCQSSGRAQRGQDIIERLEAPVRSEEMVHILKRKPFEPIRLHMSNGETFDIRHPDATIVTKSAVFTGVGGPGVFEHITWYNLLHIVKVETIDGARAISDQADSNGH